MVVVFALSGATPIWAVGHEGTPLDHGTFFATTVSDVGDPLGFSVTDDRDMALWTAYGGLGGSEALGAPVSRRFSYQGGVSQIFTRGLLRWDPSIRAGTLVDIFDDFAGRGLDPLLLDQFGILSSADWSVDKGQSWARIRVNHLDLLEGPEPWRVALRNAYLDDSSTDGRVDGAVELYGLPMAIGHTVDQYVLRTQRAVWVYDPATDSAPRSIGLPTLLQAVGDLPPGVLVPHRADERPHLPSARPTFAVHFFDWWHDPNPSPEFFTHNITWDRLGITSQQVGSPAYYDANFRLIRQLGADGVVWEWYPDANLTPSTAVLDALVANGLKIGIFYDWELQNSGGTAVLSAGSYISPDAASLNKIAGEVIAFYRGIPRDLWLFDGQGRLPVVVYGYGFPDGLTDVAGWTWFFTSLVDRVQDELAVDVVFDWSASLTQVQEFAFERWPSSYQPFNFVVDAIQPQFGSHVVTWNFVFDNRGVASRDNLLRVIRDDIRYIQEPLWLATHTSPGLVFIYSWNELFEGSHLLPDDTYGWQRFDLAAAMIAQVKVEHADDLPRALIIVDSYDSYPAHTNLRFEHQRGTVRHLLRRYVPQATAVRSDLVTPALLAGYDLIVSLTTDHRVDPALAALPDRVHVVYWNSDDPDTSMARRFIGSGSLPPLAGQFIILDEAENNSGQTLTAGDDVMRATAAEGATVLLFVDDNGRHLPLLVQDRNDFWINLYAPSDTLLAVVFTSVYGRSLEPGITFASHDAVQRSEVYPDGRILQRFFQAPAIFRHDPLPLPSFAPVLPVGI